MTPLPRWISAVLCLLALTGCSTVGFYQQAVTGQAEILMKRRAVDKLLADPSVEDPLRGRLELSRELLSFAEEELDMPSGGSYTGYSDLGRPHVVWVVHASPALSMEAKRWWYPFVGRQAYRGYFRESGARRLEGALLASGYDVWVSPVDAYSTLGYFRDPLLNTFIHRDEPLLAELLFHELAHQRHFRRGETEFNDGARRSGGA
jgi:predicted aminopeptidase